MFNLIYRKFLIFILKLTPSYRKREKFLKSKINPEVMNRVLKYNGIPWQKRRLIIKNAYEAQLKAYNQGKK